MTSPYDPFECPCGRCVTARAERLTLIEEAALLPIKARFERLGWEDTAPPQMRSVNQILDDIERQVTGEVRADD
jgi:hypothetical protein